MDTTTTEGSIQFWNELRISIAERYAAESAAYYADRAARRITPTIDAPASQG